jgi:lipoprotein-anchoring transpeptidase ErfK/SrfK
MKRLSLNFLAIAFAAISFTSCAVNEEAALETTGGASKYKSGTVTAESPSDPITAWAESMKNAREARAKEATKTAEEKAKDAAAAEKVAATQAKEKAAADKLASAKKAKDDAAAEKARLAATALKEKEAEEKRLAKLAAQGPSTSASPVPSGGLFGALMASNSTPTQYKSKGNSLYINRFLLPALNSSNARIEISLAQQKARIYKMNGLDKQLVIETQISSGKSGHTSPTGSFSISEKLESKRSTLYGRWVNSAGSTVVSDGNSGSHPGGSASFVGAEMPYWMRITGGVGMHIGYVPNYPASHGCIRVPGGVQPLIFSKVGVGTPVVIAQ